MPRYTKEVLPKSDYAGQNLPSHPQRSRNDPLSRSGGKNSFSEQTTAKFVRPAPRTVGFAARRANRFGETARAVRGTTREKIPLALSNMHSLLGTVRELRTQRISNKYATATRPLRAHSAPA
ncbi:unnamed protein product [Lasius platythorax]|uniref:Uncharacterized protein n=1 Tax=Lasius platythorax TaxID=488582 RepID=A0AAV2NGV8_9HYME